jgi:Fe-S cluster biogenesis protein NfuA
MRVKIEKVLDEIRPMLQSDGGDIEFIRATEDGIVQVRLHGACGDCSNSMMTLKRGIERIVIEQVPEVREVVIL